MADKKLTGLDLLRTPFEQHQISKLCRSTKKDNTKGKCPVCGGWHGLPAITLDYVGHAALTDRLLDADPYWEWEPLSLDADGYPVIDKDGGLWIKLRVCGVTRLGYGDAQGKTGGDAMKERIGDALRNAAMRFGAALDLWHKGDLHKDDEEPPHQANTEFLAAMKKQKERLGGDIYYAILYSCKAEHADEILDRDAQVAVYKAMLAAEATPTQEGGTTG